MCNTNTTGITNSSVVDTPMVIDNINGKINYFIPGPQQEVDEKASTEIMQHLHRKCTDVFNGIGFFNDTFSLHMKLESKPYLPPDV